MPWPSRLRRPNSSLMTQLAAVLPSRPRRDRLEEVGRGALADEHAGVVGRKAVVGDEARLLGVRQLRQVLAEIVHVGLVELERQQVGIGEVAVVVRLLLRAHGAGLALARIEQARLLVDRAAVLEDGDLPARLVVDGLADEADRVDVLDLAARAERLARAAHRDVDVGAQVALLHVAVAGAEVAQDGAQLGDVGLGLLGGAHVGPRHDLHEGDAGAVEVDEAHRRMQVVDRLAGVLLEMQALDAAP